MFQFILLAGALMVSGIAVAQGGLFPELQEQNPASAPAPAKSEKPAAPAPAAPVVPPPVVASTIGQALDSPGVQLPMVAAATDLPGVLRQQIEAAPVAQTPAAGDDKKDDKQAKEEIYIIVSDVKNIQPPMQGFSYCTAQFSLINKLKSQVQNVTAQLTYGAMNSTVAFSSVAPQGEGKASVTLVGDSCAYIMSMPQMDVKICTVAGMSVEECKKRVKLIPMS